MKRRVFWWGVISLICFMTYSGSEAIASENDRLLGPDSAMSRMRNPSLNSEDGDGSRCSWVCCFSICDLLSTAFNSLFFGWSPGLGYYRTPNFSPYRFNRTYFDTSRYRLDEDRFWRVPRVLREEWEEDSDEEDIRLDVEGLAELENLRRLNGEQGGQIETLRGEKGELLEKLKKAEQSVTIWKALSARNLSLRPYIDEEGLTLLSRAGPIMVQQETDSMPVFSPILKIRDLEDEEEEREVLEKALEQAPQIVQRRLRRALSFSEGSVGGSAPVFHLGEERDNGEVEILRQRNAEYREQLELLEDEVEVLRGKLEAFNARGEQEEEDESSGEDWLNRRKGENGRSSLLHSTLEATIVDVDEDIEGEEFETEREKELSMMVLKLTKKNRALEERTEVLERLHDAQSEEILKLQQEREQVQSQFHTPSPGKRLGLPMSPAKKEATKKVEEVTEREAKLRDIVKELAKKLKIAIDEKEEISKALSVVTTTKDAVVATAGIRQQEREEVEKKLQHVLSVQQRLAARYRKDQGIAKADRETLQKEFEEISKRNEEEIRSLKKELREAKQQIESLEGKYKKAIAKIKKVRDLEGAQSAEGLENKLNISQEGRRKILRKLNSSLGEGEVFEN